LKTFTIWNDKNTGAIIVTLPLNMAKNKSSGVTKRTVDNTTNNLRTKFADHYHSDFKIVINYCDFTTEDNSK
jgi:RNase H-fold protein (predicted Holliday junction resolvase)